MADLTPKAEALRETLTRIIVGALSVQDAFARSPHEYLEPNSDEVLRDLARTIVEQLGITDRCDCDIRVGKCAQCSKWIAACAALLELAEVRHGE